MESDARSARVETDARPAAAPATLDPLAGFHGPVRTWFHGAFEGPTAAQITGLPAILSGSSTLILAPTGGGKTLTAFLAAIDRLMFSPEPAKAARCRVLYVSPLKALAADVERNLKVPIAGIAAAAQTSGEAHRVPRIAMRSGDSTAAERARLGTSPPDILVTTPESLYLLLTSKAREVLRSVETVIVDEIHVLVGTKRGAHLFLSLERLEALRASEAPPLQRIGLSATARPEGEVAQLLGGVHCTAGSRVPRPVRVINAGSRRALEIQVEVPVGALAAQRQALAAQAGKPFTPPVWSVLAPRVVELVRQHRSTMIFVNSRRLAERFAAEMNTAAGDEIALAHHGSIAKDERRRTEQRLKDGDLRAIVATSSLELGIDIGAVDLVVQIEAPPSVASGVQRVGRAGHSVDRVPKGILFPKHRADLLAAAAVVPRMVANLVEECQIPLNPLDVLAQQVVAIVASNPTTADRLFDLVRGAAPFRDLPRRSFESVLDMLSGRYPSDEFAALRPRLTWDRRTGGLRAREGAKRVAILNGGTIPDRGLYGVYLAADAEAVSAEASSRPKSRRVGELDEEMVFETPVGDVFLLGATSWRVTEITHDRVFVVPAPGEPGKMPFWKGDRPGRSLSLGRAIGALARTLASEDEPSAIARLEREHRLDTEAAQNLVRYVHDEAQATGEVPSDEILVIQRYVDEDGDLRVVLCSPFGTKVLTPLLLAILGRLRKISAQDIQGVATDDGIFLRFPEWDAPPDIAGLLPDPSEVEDLVVTGLTGSPIFAAHFRENAGRALLLPKRRPGARAALWATRKKAADLLAVAARFRSFPIVLETLRECLRDVFDLPGLCDVLGQVAAKRLKVVTLDVPRPSPFAASVLFSYLGNFVYDEDAPPAERRARALSVDPSELALLMGHGEMADLIDPKAVAEIEAFLQRLATRYPITHADGVHDLLLSLGDLSTDEIAARVASVDPSIVDHFLSALAGEGRIVGLRVGGCSRWVAVEDALRYRDALGVELPDSIPAPFLEPAGDVGLGDTPDPPPDPLGELLSRFARTHGPFTSEDAARRFGLGTGVVTEVLERLDRDARITPGRFLRPAFGVLDKPQWCDAEVLRTLRRRSLDRLRAEVEPVSQAALVRFLLAWHGIEGAPAPSQTARRPASPDALLAVVQQLRGAPLLLSALEGSILPARIPGYRPSDLDHLCATGEVTWVAGETTARRDARIALFPSDQVALLSPSREPAAGELAAKIRAVLTARGAVFFSEILASVGGFPPDALAALRELVFAGEVTNDTLAPLRSFLRPPHTRDPHRSAFPSSLRLRRPSLPGSEGRWSLVRRSSTGVAPSETQRRAALATALLERHGVLARETIAAEGVTGGFSAIYPVLRAMEEAGRIRRGLFVAGIAPTQFAAKGADERLRSLRDPTPGESPRVLAATDPANPFGAALPWPEWSSPPPPDAPASVPDRAARSGRPERAGDAHVIFLGGELLAFLGRRELVTFAAEPSEAQAEAVALGICDLMDRCERRGLLIERIDGAPPGESPLAPHLRAGGFFEMSKGYARRPRQIPGSL